MGFKEMVEADAREVFMNLDEFAEVHEINGKLLSCIIDTNTAEQAPVLYEGVFTNLTTIYAHSMDMEAPAVDSILWVDKTMFVVRRVSDEDGILAIQAEAQNR